MLIQKVASTGAGQVMPTKQRTASHAYCQFGQVNNPPQAAPQFGCCPGVFGLFRSFFGKKEATPPKQPTAEKSGTLNKDTLLDFLIQSPENRQKLWEKPYQYYYERTKKTEETTADRGMKSLPTEDRKKIIGLMFGDIKAQLEDAFSGKTNITAEEFSKICDNYMYVHRSETNQPTTERWLKDTRYILFSFTSTFQNPKVLNYFNTLSGINSDTFNLAEEQALTKDIALKIAFVHLVNDYNPVISTGRDHETLIFLRAD